MFQELKRQLLSGQTTFTKALPDALPALRGKITDEKLIWLSSELQGYQDGLSFYQTTSHELPPYRVVPGSLQAYYEDGSMEPLNHPYANRPQHFLSAPISWIEEFSTFSGDVSIVELPELSHFMASQRAGVVVVTPKSELKRIIATFRNEFIKLLDQVMQQHPESA